ncbi:hypothetical protein I3271_09365 [Photobacterium leiognathi]|nr:hypothetical protein [Photobacterium leiognathi]
MKSGGSIEITELEAKTGRSSSLIKAAILVLRSKQIVKTEEDGDKSFVIIDPSSTTLSSSALQQYNLISSDTSQANQPEQTKTSAPKAESNNEGTVNIAPRPKKIGAITKEELLPLLKKSVTSEFFTSTAAETLNLKPESIQEALIELANDGYFKYEEQDLGEGYFEPLDKFTNAIVEIKQQAIKNIDECSNDIIQTLIEDDGFIGLSRLIKELSHLHSKDVVEEALLTLTEKDIVEQKRIGRGITIEHIQTIAKIKAEKEAEEKAQREADEKAQREADEKAQREADEKAQREADEKAQREADEKAQREADEKAQREADEKAQHEADEKAQHEADEKAQREADEKAQREADEKAQPAKSDTNANTNIQSIVDLAAKQNQDMANLLAATMTENLQLKSQLETAKALLKQHGINIRL